MKTINSLKTWIVHGSQSFHCPLKNSKLVSSKCSRNHFGGGGVIHLLPIKFPPGCRLILNDEEDESDDDILSELATCKAVLSADPGLSPDDYVVVVIYGWDKSLAFIKSGDKDWTGADHKRCSMTCQDVVVNNYPWSTFRTSGFKDFILVWLGYLSTWVEMKSLGKRVLFLGESHSTCISSSASPSLEPNSIYFTDDILARYACFPETPGIPADMVVFDLEDQSFRQCYDVDELSKLVRIPTPIWFVASYLEAPYLEIVLDSSS